MFIENRIINLEIVPPYKRRKGRGFESYKPPKEYSKTVSGKLEKLEQEMSKEEAQKVLEGLKEIGELQCPKCNSKIIQEDDADPNFFKFKCFDCGYEWEISKK